jgi:hypothetical protein
MRYGKETKVFTIMPMYNLYILNLSATFLFDRYDDGQSEWIDLTRNSFYTLKPLAPPRKSAPPAPRPKKKAQPPAKPAPKTANTKPRPKPNPSTSSAPAPPDTTSLDIKSASKAKDKTVSKPKPEPASKTKVKPVSTTTSKAALKPPTKHPTSTLTKAASRTASKTSTKAASKIPIKAATTLNKAAVKGANANAKKAAAKCGWAQRNKQIREGVAKYGTDNWEGVATMVPDWSAEDCLRRFAVELDPELSRNLLTGKEVRQIMRHQSEHGNAWVNLAFKLQRR